MASYQGAIHANSIRTIYNKQLDTKTKSFELFDCVIRNFSQINSLSILLENYSKKLIDSRLVAINPLLDNFSFEVLNMVKNGDAFFYFCHFSPENLALFTSVFKLFISGKSVRYIASNLHISPHTISMCRMIITNQLASLYDRLSEKDAVA